MNTRQSVPDLVVSTTTGPVRGQNDSGFRRWLGIPYAAAVSGDRRWRAPEPPARWTEILDASAFGPISPQPSNRVVGLRADSVMAEDCLNINIWAPDGHDSDCKLPVMVWVHGGAYMLGAGSQPLYDGAALARAGGIVVVTLNYRIGAFGFLDMASVSSEFDSNLGLRDVLLALQWIQDNIAGFHGDPQNVTLFGESAGGGIVTALLATPTAAGLFSRAIAESSPASAAYTRDISARIAQTWLDIAGGDRTPKALRGLPAGQIVDTGAELFAHIPTQTPGVIAFAPTVDEDLLPEAPLDAIRSGRGHHVPLIIGTNRDEASLFKFMKSPLMPITHGQILHMLNDLGIHRPGMRLPDEAQIFSGYRKLRGKKQGTAIARDIAFRMPTIWLADGHSKYAPTWVYRFDWASTTYKIIGLGATHAAELAPLWGNFPTSRKDITFALGGKSGATKLSARMQALWTSFAHNSIPKPNTGDPDWKPYRPDTREVMVFDKKDRMIAGLDDELIAIWGTEVIAF